MQPLENKLESLALQRAITLKTEGHWNPQNTKKEECQTTKEKIDWLLKDTLKINRKLNTHKIIPYSNTRHKHC